MTGADTRRRGGSWIGFKGEKNKKGWGEVGKVGEGEEEERGENWKGKERNEMK